MGRCVVRRAPRRASSATARHAPCSVLASERYKRNRSSKYATTSEASARGRRSVSRPMPFAAPHRTIVS